MLASGHKDNLDTLIRAAKAGRLAVLECQEKATGKVVAVLVAIGDNDEGTLDMVPFATMFDGNPYEVLNPPLPEGGFAVE
jgi:hypothetical protein